MYLILQNNVMMLSNGQLVKESKITTKIIIMIEIAEQNVLIF